MKITSGIHKITKKGERINRAIDELGNKFPVYNSNAVTLEDYGDGEYNIHVGDERYNDFVISESKKILRKYKLRSEITKGTDGKLNVNFGYDI